MYVGADFFVPPLRAYLHCRMDDWFANGGLTEKKLHESGFDEISHFCDGVRKRGGGEDESIGARRYLE